MILTAHRGYPKAAPENTLASIKEAIRYKPEFIEIDVHLSKDGEIVVCHDETLDRTTDKSGRLDSLTLAEIKSASAGIGFEDRFKGEKIPTLSEVLEIMPQDIRLNIEIKEDRTRRLIPRLIHLLEEFNAFHCTIISSFNHHILKEIKEKDEKIRISAILFSNILNPLSYLEDNGLDVYSIHLKYDLINQEEITKLQDRGIKVFTWTVNDTAEMKKLQSMGLDGIITDEIEEAQRVFIKKIS